MRMRAVLLALFLFLPATSHADPVDVVLAFNDVPEVCDPLTRVMTANADYLDYDPEKDRMPKTDNGPNMTNGDTLVLIDTYLARPIWSDMPRLPEELPSGGILIHKDRDLNELTWREFNKSDHEKFNAELWSGEDYGRSYVAYRAYLNLYGRIVLSEKEPVYKLVPRSRMSNMKMPEIYMTPGTSLADAVDKLHAQDLILYGPRGYFIVRQPGQVDLFTMDADRIDDVPFNELKFTTRRACTIISTVTLAKREKERKEREAAAQEKTEAENAVKDHCGKLKDDVTAWSACEEKQKAERLKRVQESSHTPSPPAATDKE